MRRAVYASVTHKVADDVGVMASLNVQTGVLCKIKKT